MGVIIFLLASALVIAVVFSFVYTFNLDNRIKILEDDVKFMKMKDSPIYFEEE